MKNIYAITAMDEDNGIGKNNQLPWKISADLKFFQKTTTQCLDGKRNAIIMGRRTFESIGMRPLKNRLNIVLSSGLNETENVCVVQSLNDAIQLCGDDSSVQNIYIIGGQQVYEQACKEVPLTGIYITRIKGTYDCDRFFPTLKEYMKVQESEEQTEGTMKFTYQYWIKS